MPKTLDELKSEFFVDDIQTLQKPKTTADQLRDVENGIETRKFWRAVHAFVRELEAIPMQRRRAWVNWFQARLDDQERAERQAERERHDSDGSNERTD